MSEIETYEVTAEMIYGRKLGLPPWAWLFAWAFAWSLLVALALHYGLLLARHFGPRDLLLMCLIMAASTAWSKGRKKGCISLGTNFISVGHETLYRFEIRGIKETSARGWSPLSVKGLQVITLSKPWSWFLYDAMFIPAVTPSYAVIKDRLMQWAERNRTASNSS